ncbi:MAG: helix-turn-helix domain-containing protein [Bacillus sp. (in: Bacteria)]|nr:helix-turn-helix domain-containing protein [Bacillus sp. (in: firmicutes)]
MEDNKQNEDKLEYKVKKYTGQKLRLLREKKGISREELAGRCELHVNTIRNYEIGENDMTATVLLKIALALGIEDIDILVEDSKEDVIKFVKERMNDYEN